VPQLDTTVLICRASMHDVVDDDDTAAKYRERMGTVGSIATTTCDDESLEQPDGRFSRLHSEAFIPELVLLTAQRKGVDSVLTVTHAIRRLFALGGVINAIRLVGRCFYPKNQAVGGSCEKQERRAMRNVLASSPVCSVEMFRTGRNRGISTAPKKMMVAGGLLLGYVASAC